MTGKLIRCLCGHMYDPGHHQACPECGRPAAAESASKPVTEPPQPFPPPPTPASRPGTPLSIPRWVWKGGGIALGVVVLAVVMKQFAGDNDQTGVQTTAPVTTDTTLATTEKCAAVVGEWEWFTGGYVQFSDDGRAFFKPTADAPPALTATWTCDPGTGAYTVIWSHGFTDSLKLYDGNRVIQGTSNTGVDVSGKRYIDPARGMPPLQTVAAGSQAIPRNLPALARAAHPVATNWRPDAYLVSLRIRKDGWPNKGAFYVEMSFYSPSEHTGLWVSTHLKGSKVMEAGTVSWGTEPIPETFIDLPEAVQAARKAGMQGLISRAQLRVNRRSGNESALLWNITPELHGHGAGLIDAVTGRPLPTR